jgi:hypothetical protein
MEDIGQFVDEGVGHLTGTDVKNLNNDQQQAYYIVDWHLTQTITGKNPPQ